MRASLKNYMDALKRRKEETGESGFSLIELIIVVVILGILAAIAVPVFIGLQERAEDSARDTVAANAATQVASNIAQIGTPNSTVTSASDNLANLEQNRYTIAVSPATGATITNYCVTVTDKNATTKSSKSGPGCTP